VGNAFLAIINTICPSHSIFLTILIRNTSAIPSKCLDSVSGNWRKPCQVSATYVRCALRDVFQFVLGFNVDQVFFISFGVIATAENCEFDAG